MRIFQGSLEDQLSRLREYEEAVYQFKPHLEELERINQQIQESFVFENRYSQYTMETLRVGWEQLVTSVNRTINEVENQVRHPRTRKLLRFCWNKIIFAFFNGPILRNLTNTSQMVIISLVSCYIFVQE